MEVIAGSDPYPSEGCLQYGGGILFIIKAAFSMDWLESAHERHSDTWRYPQNVP